MLVRLTNASRVPLDLSEQVVDLGSLTVKLTLSDNRSGQGGGGKGKDGEEDGLHCDYC